MIAPVGRRRPPVPTVVSDKYWRFACERQRVHYRRLAGESPLWRTIRYSDGNQSEQIDIVIHDRHFSPLLFDIGHADYIPAESVYAAFEVRPDLDKTNLEYAADKIASVRRLHRTSVDVPHAGGIYKPVELKPIIGGILCRRSSWTPPFGDPFGRCLRDLARDGDPIHWSAC